MWEKYQVSSLTISLASTLGTHALSLPNCLGLLTPVGGGKGMWSYAEVRYVDSRYARDNIYQKLTGG